MNVHVHEVHYHEDEQGIDRAREDLDVTQIRKCLEETYEQMIDVEYYKEVWWSDKFINFHDFFTREYAVIRPRNPLRYEESEEQSVILPDDFEKLFTYGQRDANRVCLVGEPGMGKTTQIINLVLRWTGSPTEFLKGFPMLFYIPLNDLPADNACIYKYIFENLVSQEIKKDLSFGGFKRFARENAEKAIFFLDGFDELKNDKAKEDIVRVTNELSKAPIVITTRESGGNMVVNNPEFTVVSISGFKKEEVIDIMKRNFPERDAEQLFETLSNKESPLSKHIYYNPLILHMFSFLYMDEEEITVPSKLTDIYIDLTCFLISKREGIKVSKNHFFGDIEHSEALTQICKVAYETLIERQNSFSENRLEPYESKMTALTCKEMSPRQKSDRSVQLRFINKSVQEFLAAVHSVVQFNEIGETPWNNCAFEQLTGELEKYGELYPRFMAGLLHRYKHNRGLGELFKTLIDKDLKAVLKDEPVFANIFDRRDSFLPALIPDYKRFVELRSESYYWLPNQLLLYLDEADCPDDAIGEIVHYIWKMLIVDPEYRFEVNTLAKILEHERCRVEVVYVMNRFLIISDELEPDELCPDEYLDPLVTAIANNASVQGVIFHVRDPWHSSSLNKYDQYLTLCRKSENMNWFVWRDEINFGLRYEKVDCEWIGTSQAISHEDEDQLTCVTTLQNRGESLFIKTPALGAKLSGDIQKSYPFLKHLFLYSATANKNIIGELTNLIPRLKSLRLRDDCIHEPNGVRLFDGHSTDEELKSFNGALKTSPIETIELHLDRLTTNQWTEISDSVGSMPKLKHLAARGYNLQIGRILGPIPRLTVLSVYLRSEADGDALVRYLSSDVANELQEVVVISLIHGMNRMKGIDRTEQHDAILRQLKNASSLRRLKLDGFLGVSFDDDAIETQDTISVELIVELIESLPRLSDLYIGCRNSIRALMMDYIGSVLIKKADKIAAVNEEILPELCFDTFFSYSPNICLHKQPEITGRETVALDDGMNADDSHDGIDFWSTK
ncbi:uncharacterized protein LOC141910915 [Tubulanus polymorphus]|uniref:uncharacterized protein LOC141910915 n=1 Tax=Tubulanus polymorphus TaxID=672921 RepID=UPI003DA3C567